MAKTHVVYPGDMGTKVEQIADDLDQSVSGFYAEAAAEKIERMESEESHE